VTQTIAPEPSAPAASKGLSLPARILGVLTSPRATYADVAARPRWVGVLLFVILVSGAATFAFLSTEVGKQALLEQQVRFMEGFGVKLNDAAYARMEAGLQRAPYTGALGQAISLTLIALIIAGIALGVFNAILGGDGKFKQVYAIVAHSGVVITLATLFGLPLAYARETMSSTTNLGVFVPFLDENSLPARFLGSIDLFQVWWIVSLSIGLGVLYRKRTGPIATTMIVIYVAIALIIAAIKSAIAGA
jgi:hypothetical protein